MLTLIKNGYVIDPAAQREGYYDVLIEQKLIRQISPDIIVEEISREAEERDIPFQLINAENKYVMPGFIDLHVHLREPGFEYKETIITGAKAAAAGGYTTICPMPNTNPVIDSPNMIRWIIEKARTEACINILPIGAITLNQSGNQLADIPGLKEAGAVALSEDGKSVMDTALYADAMKLAADLNLPIFAHCEDKSLVGMGVVNEGKKAKELNLPGISNAVEDIITARDIILAKASGAKLHLCHCSTKDSVKMVDLAKREGLPVTAEVCPHHFTLSDEDIPEDNSNYKMNPPLRSVMDVMALKEGLKMDIIDVIATDHAPHSEEEKQASMAKAPFGIVGSETAFSLTYTELVKAGYLTMKQMVEKMSVNPAKILNIDRGCIEEGKVADLVIADLNAEYIIEKEQFYSKGRNTPFDQRKVMGRIEYTFVAGRMVYQFI
jgi:dihydroorotase